MPVSYLPCVVPILLIAFPFLFLRKGKKAFFVAASGSALLGGFLILRVYVPGWVLMARAKAGDASVQFELARWHENHCDDLQRFLFWPCSPDVLVGYEWLEKSASQDHPIAVYALGVRLKYGDFVPRPPDWSGPSGNTFSQPERGQELIDRAIQLGYQPSIDERLFYVRVYRR